MVIQERKLLSRICYGLPAGTYSVDVNGVRDSFILEIDNIHLPEIKDYDIENRPLFEYYSISHLRFESDLEGKTIKIY
jgi:hypothetical protein